MGESGDVPHCVSLGTLSLSFSLGGRLSLRGDFLRGVPSTLRLSALSPERPPSLKVRAVQFLLLEAKNRAQHYRASFCEVLDKLREDTVPRSSSILPEDEGELESGNSPRVALDSGNPPFELRLRLGLKLDVEGAPAESARLHFGQGEDVRSGPVKEVRREEDFAAGELGTLGSPELRLEPPGQGTFTAGFPPVVTSTSANSGVAGKFDRNRAVDNFHCDRSFLV